MNLRSSLLTVQGVSAASTDPKVVPLILCCQDAKHKYQTHFIFSMECGANHPGERLTTFTRAKVG